MSGDLADLHRSTVSEPASSRIADVNDELNSSVDCRVAATAASELIGDKCKQELIRR